LKEYFPRDFSFRDQTNVQPTASSSKEYAWGLDRFIKEAQALTKFKHSAIVEVSDIFPANNTAYMVLSYEQALNLSDWLKTLSRPASQEELDGLATLLLDALDLIHGHGMLHRDIAPDNRIADQFYRSAKASPLHLTTKRERGTRTIAQLIADFVAISASLSPHAQHVAGK
jgi:serine/threonine protein kinase